MNRQRRRTLDRLPHELLVQILSRCDHPTLAACAMSCKALFKASHSRGRLGGSLLASSARASRTRVPRHRDGTLDLTQLGRPYGAIALLQLLRSNIALRNLRLSVRPPESALRFLGTAY